VNNAWFSTRAQSPLPQRLAVMTKIGQLLQSGFLSDVANHLKAVHARHHEIEQHCIDQSLK